MAWEIRVYQLPHEEGEARLAREGAAWNGVVYEVLEHNIRQWLKHEPNKFASGCAALEAVERLFYQEMEARGLDHLR